MNWFLVLGCVTIFLLCALGFSVYFAIRFGILILNIQDALEESLDILDGRYASMHKILSTPLFYDSPEIRKVLKDIELSRDSILYIANILTSVDEVEKEGDEKIDETEQ